MYLIWLASGISPDIISMFSIIKKKKKDTLTFSSRDSSQLLGSDRSIWVRKGWIWLLARADLSLECSLCAQNLYFLPTHRPLPCPDPCESCRVLGSVVCKSSPGNPERSTVGQVRWFFSSDRFSRLSFFRGRLWWVSDWRPFSSHLSKRKNIFSLSPTHTFESLFLFFFFFFSDGPFCSIQLSLPFPYFSP